MNRFDDDQSDWDFDDRELHDYAGDTWPLSGDPLADQSPDQPDPTSTHERNQPMPTIRHVDYVHDYALVYGDDTVTTVYLPDLEDAS